MAKYSTDKYCINCKYFKETTYADDKKAENAALCMIPNEKVTHDPVWGQQIVNQQRYCQIERQTTWGAMEDRCGRAGKYFKPKEESQQADLDL